jgi:hypothetical protein
MMAPGGVYIQNKSFCNCNSDIEYTYFVSYLDDLLDVTVSSCLVLAFRVVPFLFVNRLYVNKTLRHPFKLPIHRRQIAKHYDYPLTTIAVYLKPFRVYQNDDDYKTPFVRVAITVAHVASW